MTEIKRIASGVPGFDGLLEGGVPTGATILVTGASGTGKTLFCVQNLVSACARGENVLFISFEQNASDLVSQASRFKWDLERWVSEGKFTILPIDLLTDEDVFSHIDRLVKDKSISLLAVDSLTALQNYPSLIRSIKVMQQVRSFEVEMQASLFSPETRLRLLIHYLIRRLKSFPQVTSFLISDVDEGSNELSRDGISEFLCDGVIVLYYLGLGGDQARNLQVRKMRWTKNAAGYFPLELGEGGFVVKSEDGVSVLMK